MRTLALPSLPLTTQTQPSNRLPARLNRIQHPLPHIHRARPTLAPLPTLPSIALLLRQILHHRLQSIPHIRQTARRFGEREVPFFHIAHLQRVGGKLLFGLAAGIDEGVVAIRAWEELGAYGGDGSIGGGFECF